MDLDPYYAKEPFKKSLEENGYVMLRNLCAPQKWDRGFACPQINHGLILEEIKSTLQSVDNMLGWKTILSKFRVSATCEAKISNATDAAALHRDIAVYDSDVVPPIFTLVIYLDKTEFRLVPGSHKKINMPILEGARIYKKSIVLEMNPGDAALFHATMLHAGVFDSKVKERKVVQCFDIFPSPEVAQKWNSQIMHIWCPTDAKYDKMSEKISLLVRNKYLAKVAKIIAAIRTSGGYKIDKKLPSGVKIISGESYRKRLSDGTKLYTMQYGNVYVPVPGSYLRDCTMSENKMYRACFYSYKCDIIRMLPYVLTILIISIILYRIILTYIFKVFKAIR